MRVESSGTQGEGVSSWERIEECRSLRSWSSAELGDGRARDGATEA